MDKELYSMSKDLETKSQILLERANQSLEKYNETKDSFYLNKFDELFKESEIKHQQAEEYFKQALAK